MEKCQCRTTCRNHHQNQSRESRHWLLALTFDRPGVVAHCSWNAHTNLFFCWLNLLFNVIFIIFNFDRKRSNFTYIYLGSSCFVAPRPYNGMTLSLLIAALHTGQTCLVGLVSNHWCRHGQLHYYRWYY